MTLTSSTPFRANASPSWRGSAPAPAWKPPPWIQTITGSRSLAAFAGVQMLSVRQSSLSSLKTMSPKICPCRQRGPNSVASLTPCHGAAGRGACQRSSPTGGAPKGMPLNTRIWPLAVVVPWTRPPDVFTCAAAGPASSVVASTINPEPKSRRTQVLREASRVRPSSLFTGSDCNRPGERDRFVWNCR